MKLTLRKPDDFHLHLREGDRMAAVVQDSARWCRRALIMPNLKEPVRSTQAALDYRDEILAALPQGGFEPLMSLYLTDRTTPAEISQAKASGAVVAAKLYPQGATTNSDLGVSHIEGLYPVLEALEKTGMVLCIHGEVTAPEVDIFDREAVFLDQVLDPLVRQFPGLKVVLEHVTTAEGVAFVEAGGPNLAGTLTAHHLLINRNDLLVGGIKPHHYCLPVAKREKHRKALLKAATSGSPKFFLGSDSAPHPQSAKECASGCAGVYTGYALLPYYAAAFESAGALEALEDFASRFGAEFYGLPLNEESLTLVREPYLIPNSLEYGSDALIPFWAGQQVAWKLQ
ncbi:MAG: dihydroorotase [bacterium]|nr:dihydroorotase [bacterium]